LIYNMRYKTPCELENDPGAKEMKEGKIYPRNSRSNIHEKSFIPNVFLLVVVLLPMLLLIVPVQ
jgi:hypothetical protein